MLVAVGRLVVVLLAQLLGHDLDAAGHLGPAGAIRREPVQRLGQLLAVRLEQCDPPLAVVAAVSLVHLAAALALVLVPGLGPLLPAPPGVCIMPGLGDAVAPACSLPLPLRADGPQPGA